MRLSAMERDDAVEETQAMLKHQQADSKLNLEHLGIPQHVTPVKTMSRDDVYFLIGLCNGDIENIKERAREQARDGEDMDVVRDTLKKVDRVKEVIARLNQQL